MTIRELIAELERYDDDMIVVYPVYVNTAPYQSGFMTVEKITEVGINEDNQMELS